MTADARLRIGSLSKQFTAAASLLLEQDGKLSIDDPVNKYAPDPPPAWRGITVGQVLSHTSGIPSFTSSPEHREWKLHAVALESTYRLFRGKPLDFASGASWRYGNSGYARQ
jgi:CubicO group peptidase (beta-lactamase class C family)